MRFEFSQYVDDVNKRGARRSRNGTDAEYGISSQMFDQWKNELLSTHTWAMFIQQLHNLAMISTSEGNVKVDIKGYMISDQALAKVIEQIEGQVSQETINNIVDILHNP